MKHRSGFSLNLATPTSNIDPEIVYGIMWDDVILRCDITIKKIVCVFGK